MTMNRKTWADWLPEEITLLEEISKGSEPIRTIVDRFPRHTHTAIQARGRKLFGRRDQTRVRRVQPAWPGIVVALRDGPKTEAEMFESHGVARRTSAMLLKSHRSEVPTSSGGTGARARPLQCGRLGLARMPGGRIRSPTKSAGGR